MYEDGIFVLSTDQLHVCKALARSRGSSIGATYGGGAAMIQRWR